MPDNAPTNLKPRWSSAQCLTRAPAVHAAGQPLFGAIGGSLADDLGTALVRLGIELKFQCFVCFNAEILEPRYAYGPDANEIEGHDMSTKCPRQIYVTTLNYPTTVLRIKYGRLRRIQWTRWSVHGRSLQDEQDGLPDAPKKTARQRAPMLSPMFVPKSASRGSEEASSPFSFFLLLLLFLFVPHVFPEGFPNRLGEHMVR